MLPISDTLLVIDFQNGVCKEPQDIFNIQECVTGINSRITAYRHAHKPIIFIQHNDEELYFEAFFGKSSPKLIVNQMIISFRKHMPILSITLN